MDPASGALLRRYIAEERDSGRKFYEAYTCVMEKASKNTIGTSSHLVAESERLSKLHIDGCLSEDEFKQAFIIPHLGSATKETRTAMANLAIDNLDEFFKTGTCENKVN